jgi:predicted TIM-barrel fold metal-dependent hydrolase
MDHFALAEGCPRPNVTTMLQQAAAKRLRGVRTVLITTRTEQSGTGPELRQAMAEAAAADITGDVTVIEADYVRLSSIFEFV